MEDKTVLIDLRLALSDSLAREAEDDGLLQPQAIEALLRAELRRRRSDAFFAAADRLAGLDLPALTEAEIEAEIAAARNARKASDARRD